jgi:hypothetical protein
MKERKHQADPVRLDQDGPSYNPFHRQNHHPPLVVVVVATVTSGKRGSAHVVPLHAV